MRIPSLIAGRMPRCALCVLGLFFSTSLFLACGSDDGADFLYPLSVGTSWKYARESNTYSYADTTGTPQYQDTMTISSTLDVGVTQEVIFFDTLPAAEMLVEEHDGASLCRSTFYYGNEVDGLYSYAYNIGNSALISPRLAHGSILLGDQLFSSCRDLSAYLQASLPTCAVTTDSIIFEDVPVKVLPYPLEVGAEWTFREAAMPFRIDKEVTGREEVEVPAGGFFCYVIRWHFDLDNDGKWDDNVAIEDHVGDVGLVRRRIIVTEIIYTDQDGNPTGFADMIDDYQLQDHAARSSGSALPTAPLPSSHP